MVDTSNERYLAVGTTPTDGSDPTLTELTGEASGIGSITFGRQGTIRDVPGESKSITRQVLDFRNVTFALEIERNSKSRPWFDSSKELSLSFRYGPEGKASGDPYYDFAALVRSRINAPVQEGQTFDLTITVDGSAETGTFS